jgi:lipopolysaccharide transport system permease protein
MSAEISAVEGAGSPPAPVPQQIWSSREAHGLLASLREIWQFRELMWALSLRSLKSRYRQTLLGASWAIIQPLTLTVVFTLVFGQFAKVDTGGVPYAIFAYSAMLPWQLFSSIVTRGTNSVLENGAIVKKIYMPREVCPLSSILVGLVDFAVASLALIIFMVMYHVQPTWYLLYLPVLLLVEILLGLGIILFLSAIGVFYRDVGFGLPLVLQLGMMVSPVPYSVEWVADNHPQYLSWYMLNPLACLLDGFRRIICNQQPPQWEYVIRAAGVALLLLWAGYWYFKREEGRFADVL